MDMDRTPRQDPINKNAQQQNAITNYTVRLSPSKIFSTKPTRGPKKKVMSAPRSRVNIKSEATSSDESSESSDRPVHRNRRRRLLPSTMQTRQNTEKHHVTDNDYIVISSCCSDSDTSDDDTMAAMSLRSKRPARIHQTYLRKTSQRLKKEKAVAQKQSDSSAKNSSEVIVHPANLAGPQKFKEPRSVISVSLSQENLQSMVWPAATVIIKPLSPSSVVMSRGKYLICSQSPKCRRSSCSVATPSGSGSKVDKSSPLVSSSKSRKTVTNQSATVTSPKSTRETLSNLVAQTSAPPSDREGGPTAKETSAASSVMSTKARDEPCKSPLFGNNPSISRSLQSIKSRQPGSRECEKINADYADMIKSMRQLMPERYARKGRRSCKMSLQSESMPTPVVRLQKVVGSAEMKSRLQDGKKLLMTCRDSVAPSTGSNAVEHKNIRVASSSHSFPESETPSGTSAMKSTTSSDAKTRRMSSSPVNPDSKKRRLSRLSFGTSPSKRSSLIAPLLTSSGQIQQHNIISANQQRKLDPQRHFLAESTKGQKSSNVHRIPVDDVVERIFDKGQLSRRRALGQRISDASENSAVMSQLSHGSSVTSDSRTKKEIRIAEIEKRMKVLETLYAGNWSDEGITESPKNAGLYKSSEQDIMTSPKNAALSENAKIFRTTKSNSDHAVAVTTEKKSPSMEELVHDILVQEVVRTRRRQKLMSQRERQSNRCRTSNLIQPKKIFPTKIAESKSKRSEPGTSFSHNTTPGTRQCRDKSPVLRNSSRLSRRQSSSTLSHQRSNDCHVNNGKSRSSSSTVVPVTQHVQLPTKDLKNATDCDVTEANLNHQPNSPKATESALDSTLSPLDGAVAKKQPILDTSVQNRTQTPGIQEPVVPAGVQAEQVKDSRHEAKNKLPETSVSTRIASSSDCNASSIRQQSVCRLTDSQMFALSHFKVITFVKVPVTTVLPIRPNHNVMIAGTKPRDNFQIHNDHSYARLHKPMQDRVGAARQVGAAIPSANGRETESRISQVGPHQSLSLKHDKLSIIKTTHVTSPNIAVTSQLTLAATTSIVTSSCMRVSASSPILCGIRKPPMDAILPSGGCLKVPSPLPTEEKATEPTNDNCKGTSAELAGKEKHGAPPTSDHNADPILPSGGKSDSFSQHAACSRDEERSSSANRSMKSDDNDRDQAKQTDCDVTATGNNSNRGRSERLPSHSDEYETAAESLFNTADDSVYSTVDEDLSESESEHEQLDDKPALVDGVLITETHSEVIINKSGPQIINRNRQISSSVMSPENLISFVTSQNDSNDAENPDYMNNESQSSSVAIHKRNETSLSHSHLDDNSIPVTMTPQTSSTDDMITVSNSSSDNGMSPGSVQPSVTNNSKSLNRDVGERGHVTNDYLKLLEGIENNIIYVEDGEDDVKIPSQQQISEDSSDVIIISDGSEGVSETDTPPDDITSPMASPTQSRDGSCPSIGLTQSAPQLSVTPSPRSSPTQPIEPSQSKVSPSHPIESTSAGTFAASTNLYDIKHFFDDNLEKDSDDEELPRLLPYEELDEFRRKRSRDDSDLDQDSDEIPDLPETPSSKRRRLQLSQDSQEETSVLHRSTIRMLNESIESIHNSSIDLKGVGQVGEAERDDDIKSRLRITEPYQIEPRMQVTTIVKDNTFSEAYKKHGASLQKLVKDRMRENRIAEMEASLIADLQRGSLSQILDDCDETEGPMDELDEATKKTMILIKRDWGALPIEEVNSAIYQHGSIGFCRHTMSLDKYFSREETKALEPHLKKWVTRCKLGDRLSGRRRIIEGLLDKPATRVQTLAWAVDGMICHPDSRDFFNLVHSKLKKSETPLVDFQSFKSLVCRAGIKPEILGLDEEDNGIRSFDKICPRCRPRFRDSSRTVTVLKLISNTSVIGESVTHFVEYVTLLLLAQHETSFIFQRSEIIAIIMKCLDATHDWNATKFLVSQRLLDSPTQLNVTRDIAVRLLMMGKRAIELSRIIAFSTLSRHVLSTAISRDEDLDDLETFMPIVANFNLENIEDNLAVNDEDSNTEKRVFRQMSLLLPMLGICIARDCKDAQTSSTIDRMAGILRTMMKRIRDNGYIYRSGVKYELTAFTTTLRHLVLKAPKANKFSIFKYLRADPVEEEHVVMEQGLS